MINLKEFAYDLWTTENDGNKRYFARVKSTGETTEVSADVMRALRSEEKKMWRSIEETNERGAALSIDSLDDDSITDMRIRDSYDLCEDVLTSIMEEAFVTTLSTSQKKVYKYCISKSTSETKTAELLGITKQAVSSTVMKIRIKANKFFY